MADLVEVNLVTPERPYASLSATLVEVPGAEGDFGVLPGHAPLISSIRPGVVTIHAESGKQRFVVLGGLAEVTPERCTILGEYLEDITQITREQAATRLSEARAAVSAALSDDQKRVAERQLTIAEVLSLAA